MFVDRVVVSVEGRKFVASTFIVKAEKRKESTIGVANAYEKVDNQWTEVWKKMMPE